MIANPPFLIVRNPPARDNGRERAMGEETGLGHWVGQAAKRLAPKGHAHFIFRSERLIDLLAAIPPTCGSVVITPIVPRMGKDAKLW